ncbi:VOC family protein [Niallia sp. Krafla_26]|uniref:VOC family protein n=1 Tax=Niallia sp. Krafla_26 TaxID=3064703 RepID=UPI003D170879
MHSKAQRFEHVELKVKDLSKALHFYKDALGLVEIGKEDGVTYLGCGYDKNYDLAVKEGGTGISHFAVRVDDEEELEYFYRKITNLGVKVTRHNGTEPGQVRAIRFPLPSGIMMEFVLVADNDYANPARPAYPRNIAAAPLNIDHINLVTKDVKKETDFFSEILNFKVSDVVDPEMNGNYMMSFMRFRGYHHDVASTITKNQDGTLHHLAWTMSNFEHIKVACDVITQFGVDVEFGPGRHPIGPNLYAYYMEPGGNRFEFVAEQVYLDPSSPTKKWRSMQDTLESWSRLRKPPGSFIQST